MVEELKGFLLLGLWLGCRHREIQSVHVISRSLPPMDAIHAILTDPAYHDYLAILKGARNGVVYGAKVRFPHAVVMSILFGRGR